MPKVRFEPAISATNHLATSGQDLRLRPHGHQEWHKHDLHGLLKWLTACIHLWCDFWPQFQYSISLITTWSKSNCGFLHICDLHAGCYWELKENEAYSAALPTGLLFFGQWCNTWEVTNSAARKMQKQISAMAIIKLCQDETSASGYCRVMLKNNDASLASFYVATVI